MANVLINGMKSKIGGGKVIFEDYINILHEYNTRDSYYVLTPNKDIYLKYGGDRLNIIDIPGLFKKNLLFPILYYLVMPIVLNKYKIDIIFNLGDIIIPTKRKQIYFFDWAYAVYPDSIVWEKMDIKDRIIRRLKVFMIKKNIKKVSTVIAQTNNIRERLMSVYSLNNVEIIPNAVNSDNFNKEESIEFNLPKDRLLLLYLTNYSSHKNLEVLLPLAKKIKKRSLPYCIIVTIEQKQHDNAKKFIKNIKKYELDSVIINVGPVDIKHIPSLYNKCDALLMPTLLESYGLPYIEAMYHHRTILTSDLDFAKDVCGDVAFYFDPLDEESILDSISSAFTGDSNRLKKIAKGVKKTAQLLTSEQVVLKYQELLEREIGRSSV